MVTLLGRWQEAEDSARLGFFARKIGVASQYVSSLRRFSPPHDP
jgi:hypothetical protein